MKYSIAVLKHFGIPVTRRSAIRMAYGCEPEELDGELRAEAEEEFANIVVEQRADNLRLRALGVGTKRKQSIKGLSLLFEVLVKNYTELLSRGESQMARADLVARWDLAKQDLQAGRLTPEEGRRLLKIYDRLEKRLPWLRHSPAGG